MLGQDIVKVCAQSLKRHRECITPGYVDPVSIKWGLRKVYVRCVRPIPGLRD